MIEWQRVPFSEAVDLVSQRTKVKRTDFLQSGRHPIVSQEAGLINGFWDDDKDLIGVRQPVVVFGDHTRVLKYVDFDFVVGADGVKVLSPRSDLNAKFLFYQLQTLMPKSLGYSRHFRLLKETELSVPPLPVQRRIVALLDEAFAAIDQAIENTKRNIENAKELFESTLHAVYTDQWCAGELVTLADLSTDITDGDHMPPPKTSAGIPFITIGNIVKGTREIDFSKTYMVPRDYYDSLKANKKPRNGDVLYTVTGSFGIPVIVPKDIDFCFQRHIGLVRPKPDTDSAWLYYLLMSPQVFKQANEGATGTAQRTVSLKLLRSLVVPRVTQMLQHQAVYKLSKLDEHTQRLSHLYERELLALEELKGSLLYQAICGKY